MPRLLILFLALIASINSHAYISTDQFEIRMGSEQVGAPVFIRFFGFTVECFDVADLDVSITEMLADDPSAPFGRIQRLDVDARGSINPNDIGCDTVTDNTWEVRIGQLKVPTLEIRFRHSYPASRNPGALIIADVIIDTRIQLLNPLGASLQPEDLTTLDQATLLLYTGCPVSEAVLTEPRTVRAGTGEICEPEDEVWMNRSVQLPRLASGDWIINARNRFQNTEAASNLFVGGEVFPASRNDRFDIDVRHAVPTEASGLWYNPDQNGEGLTVLVLDDQRIIALWYTFDPDGELVWVYGDGVVQAAASEDTLDVTVNFDAYRISQSQASLQSLKAATDLNPWGSWTMVFSACDQANFAWQPNQGDWLAGEMVIEQLAGASSQDCQSRQTVQ